MLKYDEADVVLLTPEANKNNQVQELPCVHIFLAHVLFFFFLDPETKNQDCIKKAKNYQVSLK
jgi:hypothetical protein